MKKTNVEHPILDFQRSTPVSNYEYSPEVLQRWMLNVERSMFDVCFLRVDQFLDLIDRAIHTLHRQFESF